MRAGTDEFLREEGSARLSRRHVKEILGGKFQAGNSRQEIPGRKFQSARIGALFGPRQVPDRCAIDAMAR
jgi:hypothetical protein